MATTMTVMAFQAQRRGRYDESTALFAETVTLWERLGDVTAVELAISNVAHSAKTAGDFQRARRLLEQLVASSQARGDIRAFTSALNGLGDVAAAEGNHDAARRYYQESLARYREIDDRWGIARVLADLATVDLHAEDYEVADRSLMEALQAFRALGHQRGVARQLEALSRCAGNQSRHEAAVRLAGAAAAIRQRIGAPNKPLEREKVERTLAQARAGLGDEAYGAAWKEGHSAPLESDPRSGDRPAAVMARDRISGVALRIDQPAHRRDAVGRHAELLRVFTNHGLVGSKVDTIESVVGDVAVQPLDLRSDPPQNLERLDRDVPDLVLGHLAGAGNLAFDDVLWHGAWRQG